MIDREAAKALELTVGVTLEGEHFRADLAGGAMPVRRADAGERADVTFAAAAPPLLARLFYGKQPLAEAEQAGVAIAGDRALAERFIALFALPAKLA